ncbi:uncharacterized protein LOC110027463 [Phalaenopsis equestris]|uniref:uncharacterized protein LOC110027463 n=1 Tax=Phalaenopsis equestris TaxID=78828 RepID=UPI0009E45A26|nr:uncharacterized protein LOC110027463 [Phalaenopsis equestris]
MFSQCLSTPTKKSRFRVSTASQFSYSQTSHGSHWRREDACVSFWLKKEKRLPEICFYAVLLSVELWNPNPNSKTNLGISMASGGSSVHSAAGSRSFDFGSDDVLCFFDDCTLKLDPMANGKRFDSSSKDLHENRVRSPSANIYGSEEFSREDVIYIIEKFMKKYSDKLTIHLEGISGRLTQLELFCYKLERSIGEFRTDVIRDHSEANLYLKSLDKHVHEVHRSVQIIRDKQELFETQTELTKLQLSQKDSINVSYSQKNYKDINTAPSEIKANYESNDEPNQQLALTLPCQISSPPPSICIAPPYKNHPEQDLPLQQSQPVSFSVLPRDYYVMNQANAYYHTHHQPFLMEQQSQNPQPELHYAQHRVKMQDISVQPPPKQEHNVAANQPIQQPPLPQYQQHWSQPMQPQQPSARVQSPRFQTPTAYASYALNPHANKIPEAHQGSSILQSTPYATSQSVSHEGSTNTNSHLPPQLNMQQQQVPQASQVSFVPPRLADCGYLGTSTYPPLGYKAVYANDGNRAPHLQSCHLGSYPPIGNAAASLIAVHHPYADMIEKAVGMGYPRDQIVGVVLGTAESG